MQISYAELLCLSFVFQKTRNNNELTDYWNKTNLEYLHIAPEEVYESLVNKRLLLKKDNFYEMSPKGLAWCKSALNQPEKSLGDFTSLKTFSTGKLIALLHRVVATLAKKGQTVDPNATKGLEAFQQKMSDLTFQDWAAENN